MVTPMTRHRREGIKLVAVAGSQTAAVSRILLTANYRGFPTHGTTLPPYQGTYPNIDGVSDLGPITMAHTLTKKLFGFPLDAVGNLLTATLVFSSTPVTMAAAISGASSVVLSATTMTGSVKAGDQLAIRGHTYFVSATAASSANSVTAAIVPNLVSAIPAGTGVTYTAGSTAGSLANTGGFATNGTIAAGATTLTLKGVTTLTGSVVVGDQITISAVVYYVTAGATAAANIVSVQVQPPVPSQITTGTVFTYTKNVGGTLSPTSTGSVNSSTGVVSGVAAGALQVTASVNGVISNPVNFTMT